MFDSIWGELKFSTLCKKIIYTYEFQRLRNIKQMGVTYFIHPNASVNRFEHSLGVSFLAGEWLKILKEKNPDIINERLIELYKVAGLIHDIGHGPFSHVFDKYVFYHDSPMRIHENRSIAIFRKMVKKYKLELSKDEIDFIALLVYPQRKEKEWKFNIISSDVDVDRFDYVIRDQKYLLSKYLFCKDRILNIMKSSYIDENNILRFGLNSDIDDFLSTRKFLYENFYKSENGNKIENILINIFKKSEYIHNMKTSIDCIERFIKFDDSVLNKIQHDSRKSHTVELLIKKIWNFNLDSN